MRRAIHVLPSCATICLLHGPASAPDVIKVANLLNPKYFTDAQMEDALRIQCANLALNGRLLLVSEDDDIEKFSVFRKSSTGMVLEHTHGGGAKASHLVPLVFDLALGPQWPFWSRGSGVMRAR